LCVAVRTQLPTFANRTPEITMGEVTLQLEAETAKIHA